MTAREPPNPTAASTPARVNRTAVASPDGCPTRFAAEPSSCSESGGAGGPCQTIDGTIQRYGPTRAARIVGAIEASASTVRGTGGQ